MSDPMNGWESTARRAFVDETEMDDATWHRLRHRLAESSPQGTRPWRWGALALATAVALVALALVGRTEPPSEPWSHQFVSFEFEGQGHVAKSQPTPHLVWQDGTVHVEVEPNRGVELTVSTEEATVEVVGTAFSVTREAYATEVVVTRGKVAVTCIGDAKHLVTGGERTTCLPDDLPTLLLRASALAKAHAALPVRLATLDRAAARPGADDAAAGELLAHRFRAFEDAGQLDDALAVARAYLDAGHIARRASLLGFAARRAYDRRGCDAQADLELAVEERGPGPEALLLASCLVRTDPARASALVEASAPVVDEAWAASVQQLREALPEPSP